MVEFIMIAEMGIAGILFAIGGTGYKWVRRFVLPVFLGLMAFLDLFVWWQCLGMCLGMIAAFHMGYGEKKPYWYKLLVGVGFVAPTLFLGFTAWQIITPLLFLLMFWLSNIKLTSSIFKWKIVEFLTGALIGVTVASLMR